MNSIRLVNIKESILSDNENLAEEIRQDLKNDRVFMLNLMASPGAGKTSLLLQTIKNMKNEFEIGVIEGDIDSLVDSEKIHAEGIPAVQLQTGGACHLDAPMIKAALEKMDMQEHDLIFIENIGNLVCPAEFDTGADLKVMILSVPEGDDKVLKYPLMFSVCDALIVNKIDYMGLSDFNLQALKERVKKLNPDIKMFEISCKTGTGVEEWCNWLAEKVRTKVKK